MTLADLIEAAKGLDPQIEILVRREDGIHIYIEDSPEVKHFDVLDESVLILNPVSAYRLAPTREEL